MCNATHLLLVIGKEVTRMPFRKCGMSLTPCWSKKKMWWDCLSQNVQSHSLSVGNRKKYDETGLDMQVRKCANLLLVIGKDVMRLPFTKVQCHSQTVGHRRGYDKTAFHKMCNGAHSLLIIGKYVMRLPLAQNLHFHSQTVGHRKDVMTLPFTKHAMVVLTCCWSREKTWWDCLSQNVQFHSLPVGHWKDLMTLPSMQKKSNVTHKLLVIGRDVMRLSFTKWAMSLTNCWS